MSRRESRRVVPPVSRLPEGNPRQRAILGAQDDWKMCLTPEFSILNIKFHSQAF